MKIEELWFGALLTMLHEKCSDYLNYFLVMRMKARVRNSVGSISWYDWPKATSTDFCGIED